MTLRTLVVTVISMFYPLVAFAHSGDHPGMGNVSIALHHAVIPMLIVALIATSFIIAQSRRKRVSANVIDSRDLERSCN